MSKSEGQSAFSAPETPTPEQTKYLALVRELTDSAAIMVIKVASCKCDKRDQCKLYQQGRRIADIVDNLQEIRIGEAPTIIKGRGKGGKTRRSD